MILEISQKGTRLGNWLTREQAEELLVVPDRSPSRANAITLSLAHLVGALRRNVLADLDVETIQQREGRWALADLEGKAGASSPSPSQFSLKQCIDACMIAAGFEDGWLLRSVSKSGNINGTR
jgi:hypothetical protein